MTLVNIEGYQQLMLANDLFPLFHTGDKRLTCRKGRRDIQLDDLLFISTDPVEMTDEWDTYCRIYMDVDGQPVPTLHMCQLVTVHQVRYKRVRHVDEPEAIQDGFESVEALYHGMKRFYPDLTLDDELTFVYFNVP